MQDYKSYACARDKAWQILIDCKISSLPVCVSRICRHYGWRLTSYTDGERAIGALELSDLRSHTDGFCISLGNKYYIFYDDTTPRSRQRFTVAHEIGHIVLGHIGNGEYTHINREPSATDAPEEIQANQFAVRLLAPAWVLRSIHALTAEDIAKVCDISMTAAQFRAERMTELERRNVYLSHPLERQVAEQFQSYICRILTRGWE